MTKTIKAPKTAKTVESAYERMQKHAEGIRSGGVDRIGALAPNDSYAQGDLLLVKMDRVPAGATRRPNPQCQIALGATQGSRHCLDSLEGITQWDIKDATELDGPVLEADRPFAVTHPEHRHLDFTCDAGVYGVVYQRTVRGKVQD